MNQKLNLVSHSLWRTAMVAGILSVAGNLAVWGLASLAGVDIRVPESPGGDTYGPLPAGALIIASFLPAPFAAAVLWTLERFAGTKAVAVFVAGGAVATVLSMASPMALDAATSAKVVLGLTHLIAAAAVLGLLTLSAERRRRGTAEGAVAPRVSHPA